LEVKRERGRKGRLQKELNFSARNKRQKKLQLPRKLYNYPIEAREQCHNRLLKVVVEVVSLNLPHLQNAPEHAVSAFHLDIQISQNNCKALFTILLQIFVMIAIAGGCTALSL
jgi:hypothetical protein